MTPNILMENQGKRICVRLPLLICFALYGAWQLGVIYFSGTAASIGGRTPIPVNVGNLSLMVAIGYLLSIGWVVFLPHRTILAERGAVIAALVSALALYLPLPAPALAACYSFHCLCCVFMVAFETGLLVNLFQEQSILRYLMLAYPVAFVFIAVLQNDIFSIPFGVFQLFILFALALMLVFFFRLPAGAGAWPSYVKKGEGLVCPKRFFTGLFLLSALGAGLFLLGGAVAEGVKHGLFTLYLSAAASSLVAWVLWKRFAVAPIRTGTVFSCVAAVGFLLSILSLTVDSPVLSLIACVLLGCGALVCNLSMYYGAMMMRRYPSRWICPIIIGSCLGVMVIHTFLLEQLRSRLDILYLLYLAIAISVVILYLALEPYLLYSFHREASPPPLEPHGAGEAPEPTGSAEAVAAAAAVTVEPETAQALEAACAYDTLSEREKLLAEYIRSGYSNREMADLMGVSENTIKYHRKNLYAKLQIHSKRELFDLAQR